MIASSVATAQHDRHDFDAQTAFWNQLSALCGNAFGGELVTYEPVEDARWVGQPMTIHVRDCSSQQLKIPLMVGDDRSRTWVLTRRANGLELKHIHRHANGEEDAVSWYGGQTHDGGTHQRQAFVADGYSKSLFYAQGLDVSVDNIWYLAIDDGQSLTYGLTRPDRHFSVKFDLTESVDTPPMAWGHTP